MDLISSFACIKHFDAHSDLGHYKYHPINIYNMSTQYSEVCLHPTLTQNCGSDQNIIRLCGVTMQELAGRVWKIPANACAFLQQTNRSKCSTNYAAHVSIRKPSVSMVIEEQGALSKWSVLFWKRNFIQRDTMRRGAFREEARFK